MKVNSLFHVNAKDVEFVDSPVRSDHASDNKNAKSHVFVHGSFEDCRNCVSMLLKKAPRKVSDDRVVGLCVMPLNVFLKKMLAFKDEHEKKDGNHGWFRAVPDGNGGSKWEVVSHKMNFE